MAAKKPAVERKVRTSRVPENETREQRFIRLATGRVNKVRKALDQLGQLGSPSYSSTEEQRNKIEESIRESVEFNINRLHKVKLSKTDFKL